jgi:hypothetical protein
VVGRASPINGRQARARPRRPAPPSLVSKACHSWCRRCERQERSPALRSRYGRKHERRSGDATQDAVHHQVDRSRMRRRGDGSAVGTGAARPWRSRRWNEHRQAGRPPSPRVVAEGRLRLRRLVPTALEKYSGVKTVFQNEPPRLHRLGGCQETAASRSVPSRRLGINTGEPAQGSERICNFSPAATWAGTPRRISRRRCTSGSSDDRTVHQLESLASDRPGRAARNPEQILVSLNRWKMDAARSPALLSAVSEPALSSSHVRPRLALC